MLSMSKLESSSMSTISESPSSPDSDLIRFEEGPVRSKAGETVPSRDRRSEGLSRPSQVFSASASAASSSSQRFRGDQVILFSFFSRRRAFANQVET